ncbi:MAG: GNAT family N-acetyltransferase [Thaumarchaeota archaeon]|nr:GNAT family N-acetyltransferase [Nitrososphaerota archaeon]
MLDWLVRMHVIERNNQVLGYDTLAMARLRSDASEKIKELRVNENIPALLLSHLAVHEDFKRRKIGTKLLDSVFELVPKLQKRAGCRYVVLSPRDDAVLWPFTKTINLSTPEFKMINIQMLT